MGTVIVVIAVVVVAAIVWFVFMRRGGERELPPERKIGAERRPPREAAPKPARKPEAEEALEEPPEPAEEIAAEPAAEKAAPEAAPPREPEPVEEPERPAAGPTEEEVAALKKGLASTRGGFISRLAKLFGGKKEIAPELLDEIEEVLITADIGVKTTQKVLDQLRDRMARKELSDPDKVWDAIREEARGILDGSVGGIRLRQRPTVVLVVGVNGVGKTTTIGKLASRYIDQGKKVLLAAGDTFRAAAVLQLEVWGRKVGCEVVKGKERADPASVIFEAVKRGVDEGYDVVIADTAGRLHTKANLMEEIKKVARTVEKALDGRAADETLLVLDSTTGQNAIAQTQMFKDALPITGIVLTKLDGTAKGGVILGIVDEHQVPIRYIGIGERVEDLKEFDAASFVQALFEKPDDESLAA